MYVCAFDFSWKHFRLPLKKNFKQSPFEDLVEQSQDKRTQATSDDRIIEDNNQSSKALNKKVKHSLSYSQAFLFQEGLYDERKAFKKRSSRLKLRYRVF